MNTTLVNSLLLFFIEFLHPRVHFLSFQALVYEFLILPHCSLPLLIFNLVHQAVQLLILQFLNTALRLLLSLHVVGEGHLRSTGSDEFRLLYWPHRLI